MKKILKLTSLFAFLALAGCSTLVSLVSHSPAEIDSQYETTWKGKTANDLISKRYPDLTTQSASGARMLIYNRQHIETMKSDTWNSTLNSYQRPTPPEVKSTNFPNGLESINVEFYKTKTAPIQKDESRFFCSAYFEVNQTTNLIERIYWIGNDCDASRL